MRRLKEDDTRFVDIANSYKRFVDIIHFTENISTRIHSLRSEDEIFNAVKSAFKESEDYSTVILTLGETESVLNVMVAALPDKKMKAAEKVGNFRMENFSIKIGKSKILGRVISGQETVHFNIKELVGELFPKTLVNLIWKAAKMQDKYCVVTPLKKYEKVIGAFSMTCPEFAQEFIPTAVNLAQHISYALELASENEERRKVEEALKESESSLWLAQHLAKVGHWEWNFRDGVFRMSDHMRFIYGLKQEVFNNTEDVIERLIHPEDREYVRNATKKVAGEGIGKPLTYRIIRPDGEERWIAATSPEIRTFNEKEEPEVMFGVIQDITERRKVEEEVKNARDDYRATTNLTGDIIVKIDKEGKWTFLNSAARKFWGKPKKDIIGNVFADYLHPDDYIETMDAIEKIKMGKIIKGLINRQETPKGWRIVEWNGAPIYDKNDNYIGLQATGRDITERREAEKALKDSESKYRAIFEGSADGILIADVTTKKFKFANKSLCKMLGYSEQEIMRLGVFDIHPKESLDHVIDEFMAQAKGEKTLSENIPCLRKDGSIVYADFNTRPMTLNGDKYNIGFVRDVTERKKAEKEKMVLEEQLRQSEKLRAIGELAGGVAHDFNNMLGAITGYADLIAEENRDENGKDKDVVLGKRISTISRASYRAADLIKKLLAFSRRGKYRDAPMDMHEIINDVLTLLEGSIDRKITIKKKLAAAYPVIKGDPSQIQNAVLNLAINACDAMKDGGVMLISTRNENLVKDQCCDEMDAGSYLVVSVSDSGKGMDSDTMSRIFEPFFSTKGTGEGTGLGLPSVYGTLKSHKGCVTVESKKGVGSRLKLYLPVSEQEETTLTTLVDNDYMERGQGTILLVDDEEMVRSMVSESLIRCGYTVYTCNNGSEAVEWYKEFHSSTDLVILDMVMPVMDGMECYENLKKINPGIKVILASGFSINKKVRKMIEKGSLEFIEKPFSRIDLSRLVAKLLKNRDDIEIKTEAKEQIAS